MPNNVMSIKQHYKLINQSEVYKNGKFTNHNKFYEAWLENKGSEYYIVKKWGRVGTSGQTQREGPYSYNLASLKLSKLIASKRSRGYK